MAEEKYLPRCPAIDYDAIANNYHCLFDNSHLCNLRGEDILRCKKYREQVLPRRQPIQLEART